MQITAKITGISYTPLLAAPLKVVDFSTFDINDRATSCIVQDEQFSFAISKWVSPKRTRSYPYERVYNTLAFPSRITVIPVIKDEGKRGDRDFIQWDTISLMSLLNVFVIFAYYADAEKHRTREDKISHQRFDNEWVRSKIQEIACYHSSALHWNVKEIKDTLPEVVQRVKDSYRKISEKTGVEFHSEEGIDRFASRVSDGAKMFRLDSRQKSKEAQHREMKTTQPKEALSTDTKATITIENYLGGEYHLTVDETEIRGESLFLIEGKHSQREWLPSKGDIKDALLKMFLFTNLQKVTVDGKKYHPVPVVRLTSSFVQRSLSSEQGTDEIRQFCNINNLTEQKCKFVSALVDEAQRNHFLLEIKKASI